jgi:hypothetical protein
VLVSDAVKEVATLSTSAPRSQCSPASSRNTFGCAATFPNRVGVSKAMPVCPLEILDRGVGLILELGAVVAPVLLERDQHLRCQLGDVAEPYLGALLRRTVRDSTGKRVHVAGRAVVDDCDSGHAPNLWVTGRRSGLPRVRSAHDRFLADGGAPA